ncbi:hypothetical protein NQ314_020238 [Rhamnusium bicolor]|uniref:Uncharacterized protein n=1 Tax=Rhamnusium bicolor TaxID=1586634 RepID=A0AAV8WKQ4_9CUCU|nr:hypothetical protein NQ314_020238 [Rhamnusium bicolor]
MNRPVSSCKGQKFLNIPSPERTVWPPRTGNEAEQANRADSKAKTEATKRGIRRCDQAASEVHRSVNS